MRLLFKLIQDPLYDMNLRLQAAWLAKSFPLVHIVQIETYDCVCLLMISSYIGAINIIVVV